MIFANFENLPLWEEGEEEWGGGCISPELIIESKHLSEKPTRTYVEINLNPWDALSCSGKLAVYLRTISELYFFLFALPLSSL